mmetsp:Transcript_1909/g.3781  ORF Transcript_1909/g.3781 Transcript_1909/m.3781 type:complete len:105 (+) Transcript_1909:1113-1427(+)
MPKHPKFKIIHAGMVASPSNFGRAMVNVQWNSGTAVISLFISTEVLTSFFDSPPKNQGTFCNSLITSSTGSLHTPGNLAAARRKAFHPSPPFRSKTATSSTATY